MSRFLKQFVFVSLAVAILMIGGLAIYSATPQGGIKINPILGHDLDLNAKYYAQAVNNTVHDITTQDISVSAWVKVDVDSGTGYEGILQKRTVSGTKWGYTLAIYNNKLNANIIENANSYTLTGNATLNDNKWHYVSVIIDRDTTANCKLFIDGYEDGTTNKSGTLSVVSITNDAILTLGAWVGGSLKFEGQLRDVKLYYAAGDHWSDAQVLYQAQHPFDYTANAGTLTDYWRLDEGSGTTLYGKVNNLTLSNVLAWTTQPKIKMVNQENTTTTGNNPVGWWSFDDGVGASAQDKSGNGNTGTLTNGPTWTTGKLGKGLSFVGQSDAYVNGGNVSLWNLANTSHSFALWFKVNSGTGWLLGRFTGGTPGGGYLVSFSNSVLYFAENANTNAASLTFGTTNTYNDNKWHHIVITVDIGSLYARGYIDGRAVNGDAFSNDLINFSDVLHIGGKGSSYNMPGSIDDVRIYNRALTDSEVAQMYNSTKDGYLGKIKVSTGLVGYWKMDDASASSAQVTDYSGKNNNGTAYSGTATTTSVLSTSTAMVGRAFSFDGVDDSVKISNFDYGILRQGSETSSWTLSAWAKPAITTQTSYSPIVGKVGFNGGLLAGDNVFYFLIASSGGWTGNITWLSYTPTNMVAWHHLVGVYNNKKAYFYVDGVLRSTDSNGVDAMYGYGTNFYVGSFKPDYAYPFNGLIDEVKIWNYARSAEDIKNDYVRGTMGRSF